MAMAARNPLPEPPINPPHTELEDYHYDLLDRLDAAQREMRDTGFAVEAWEDFKDCLVLLDTPEILHPYLAMIEGWLKSHLGAIQTTVGDLVCEEDNLMFPWK
jgi:hypothetical protein